MPLIYKSLIYRLLRVGILLIISYAITDDITNAMSISIIDMVVATGYYYLFEIYWNKFLK